MSAVYLNQSRQTPPPAPSDPAENPFIRPTDVNNKEKKRTEPVWTESSQPGGRAWEEGGEEGVMKISIS